MNECIKKLWCIGRYTHYLASPFVLVLRLYWGLQFFQAGMGKLTDIQKPIEFFMTLGIPFPGANAYLVGSVEMIGGVLLVVGLFSRLAALPLTCTMIVAYLTAHKDALMNIFVDPKVFFAEPPFLFLMMLLVVLSFGPGAFSLDRLFAKHWCHDKDRSDHCCSS